MACLQQALERLAHAQVEVGHCGKVALVVRRGVHKDHMAAVAVKILNLLGGEAADGEDAVQLAVSLADKMPRLIAEEVGRLDALGKAHLLQGGFHVEIIGILQDLLHLKHLGDTHAPVWRGAFRLGTAAGGHIVQRLGGGKDFFRRLGCDTDGFIVIEHPGDGGNGNPRHPGNVLECRHGDIPPAKAVFVNYTKYFRKIKE